MWRVWKFVTDFVNEYYYLFTYPFLSIFHFPKIVRTPHPKGTIILISCWFTRNIYHDAWVAYLERKGFRTYLWNLPMMFESFETTAGRLNSYIKERKLKHYTLVGISTGALLCFYFLYRYKKWKEVHKFISVGGPLHGSILALFISFTGKGRAMLPGSNFIRTLEQIRIPKEKMITLSAAFDELVPKKSSTIRGNTSYIIPVWGHNRFHLSCRKTYDLIIRIASQKRK